MGSSHKPAAADYLNMVKWFIPDLTDFRNTFIDIG